MRPTISSICLAVMLISTAPRPAHAGISDLLSRAAAWWHAKGIAAVDVPGLESRVSSLESDGGSKPENEGNPGEAMNRAPGMCVVPREPPATACELGSGFLCVDTPPGGVAGDAFVLHGTIDRAGSVVASVRIVVQNEYTKKTAFVDTSHQQGTDCRGDLPRDVPFCLDAQGYFAARVPLATKGPHTISVSASRLSGESLERRVRTSRVVALAFDEGDLAFDPDVRTQATVDAQTVMVTLELLGACQFCDFIGASTGGVRVTALNVMQGPDGAVRRIGCPTTVEQGGAGRFAIGVPVGPGRNELTITACNAAVEGRCPSVGDIAFEATGDAPVLEIISPPPAPAYDAASHPTIDWQFSLGSAAACVGLQFNREAPREVCPDASGRFAATLTPRVGINVATLAREGGAEEFAWTFGWGAIQSPHEHGGMIDVPDALRLALPVRTVNRMVLPLLNHFLNADERDAMIERLFAGGGAAPAGADDGPPPAPIAIPKCENGGGLGGYAIALRGKPQLAGAEIGDAVFENDRMGLRAVFKGLRIGLDLAPDENGDKRPDRAPLPLVIAFKKAILEAAIEAGRDAEGRPLLLATAPNDDCDFKDDSYCTGMPAVLVPKNFVGDANEWGGFIECDEGKAAEEAKEACRAVNSLNAQTGILSEKILDAINGAVYCSGSAALTRAARDGIRMDGLALGCEEGGACEGTIDRLLPRVQLPLALVLGDGVDIAPSGIVVSAGMAVGRAGLYDRTPERFHVPQAGLIAGEEIGARRFASSQIDGDIALALSLDAVDAMLFAATVQGDGRGQRGLLDFDIDEDFFTNLGFDFVEQCDRFVPVPGEKEAPPTLCYIRPRVGELLGTPLTTYGYFPGNQPLLMAVRGNRALSPRLSVRELSELPVVPRATEEDGEEEGDANDVPTGNLLELELGGAGLSFYALEIDPTRAPDEFGNPQLKRDGQGRPIIHSMKPEDPDSWNGQIVGFDLTVILAIEVGGPSPDPDDPGSSVVTIRLLSDRSRLIIVPLPGTNATTVPAAALISQLSEKLKLAIAGMSSREKPIRIPVPQEISFDQSDAPGLFGMLGIEEIAFGPDGIRLAADPATNSIALAIQAVITQVLHKAGERVEYTIPTR